MRISTTDRAQVESLGSLLLVAVVVISAGTFGVYYVASTTGGSAGGAAGGAGGADSIDPVVDATQDELRLSHNGGASVPISGLRVIVENGSGEYTYAFDEGMVRGDDGDATFDAGETWRLAWNQSPDTEVAISLVDADADRLLFRGSATVGSPATDSFRAIGENVSADPDGEESSDDGPSEPWLDVDDDGRFEEEDGDTTVDLSGGEIPDGHEDTAEDATLRVPADVTVDTGDDELEIDDVKRIRIAGTVRSDEDIELEADRVSLNRGRLDNSAGSSQLSVDSENDLTADGSTLTSADTIELRSTEAMSVDNAEVDNTAAGDKGLTLDSEASLTADGSTLASAGKIEILSKDEMSVDNAEIDNTAGDGALNLDSGSALTADGSTLTSADTIEFRSKEAMSVDNAEVDNTAAGDKNLKLDSEAGLTADGSTLTSAGKVDILSKGDMSVQNATVDNTEGDKKSIFVESKSDLNADNATFTASGQVKLKSTGEKSDENTEINENEG